MKPNHTLRILFALTTTVAYGQTLDYWPGENGVVFSGTSYDSSFEGFPDLITYDLFASTPDDMLVVDFILNVTAGTVYQNHTADFYGLPFADNTRPPRPGPLSGTFIEGRALAADSWVTTPGAGTACAQIGGACPGFENVGQVSHFDTSGEGVQTEFNFARITLIPDEQGAHSAEFSGYMQVANQPSPIVEPFNYAMRSVPEPNSLSSLMAALMGGLTVLRKRQPRGLGR